MSNELTINLSLDITNGTFRDNFRPGMFQADQAAQGKASGVQAIGTSEEALVLGDVANPGWACFTNLDATNYIQIGVFVSATFHAFARLKAGKSALLPLDPSMVYYAKANTAVCKLDYRIYEA